METDTNLWTTLGTNTMFGANPAELSGKKIPNKTGFIYQLGGGQTWGLYFPNGGEVLDGGFFMPSTKQPIEVWDDSHSPRSRGSKLEELTFGIPGFIPPDVSAKGLQFNVSGPQSWTSQKISGSMASATSPSPTTTPATPIAPGDYAAYQKEKGLTDDDDKPKAKGGRNTAGAKIIAIGNWDVVPKFLSD